MIKQVVVTDAWVKHQGDVLLNPALKPLEQALLSMKQTWASAETNTPLSWYAENAQLSPASLVASLSPALPEHTQQVWLASPYHARLTRSNLMVMPEYFLDWSADIATHVCELLNPLLQEEGLQLICQDELLLLCSDKVWDIQPLSFADIAGNTLPNKHMRGADAGLWSRLLSEVQMMLHQSPVLTKQGLEVHGLWFWGGTEQVEDTSTISFPSVASTDVYLQRVLQKLDKQQNAQTIVSYAEQLDTLLPTVLPENWLLLGAGKSVRLKNNMLTSVFSKLRQNTWKGLTSS